MYMDIGEIAQGALMLSTIKPLVEVL